MSGRICSTMRSENMKQGLLVFVTSQLLLIVFIFGNTLKTIFEAIVFLFVMHPFDVGHRCVIDGVTASRLHGQSTTFVNNE